MPLGLLKMCVGVAEIDQLARWQHARLARLREAGEPERLRHLTRHTPRRSAEILDGGSLYWIIKGYVRVRQRIVAIERVSNEEGETKCGLVLDPTLVRTELQPAPAAPGLALSRARGRAAGPARRRRRRGHAGGDGGGAAPARAAVSGPRPPAGHAGYREDAARGAVAAARRSAAIRSAIALVGSRSRSARAKMSASVS